jgi:hypothetical protein
MRIDWKTVGLLTPFLRGVTAKPVRTGLVGTPDLTAVVPVTADEFALLAADMVSGISLSSAPVVILRYDGAAVTCIRVGVTLFFAIKQAASVARKDNVRTQVARAYKMRSGNFLVIAAIELKPRKKRSTETG